MRVLAEVWFSTFCTYYWWKGDERVSRIELPSLAWEANALTVVLYPHMTAGTVTLRLAPGRTGSVQQNPSRSPGLHLQKASGG